MARIAWMARGNGQRGGQRGNSHKGEDVFGKFCFHLRLSLVWFTLSLSEVAGIAEKVTAGEV